MTSPEQVPEVAMIRLPCSHLVERPRTGTSNTITCTADGRVFKVGPTAGGHAWAAQEYTQREYREAAEKWAKEEAERAAKAAQEEPPK